NTNKILLLNSIMEIVDFRHCVQERDECGQRGMGKYISACKIQSGRSSTRFPPFLQSILDSVQMTADDKVSSGT
ncbi:hypothetical protein, partial [Dialister invisus]|uniref:hypothetical protein n=2 Tax=Veillonellaceae TaxID=31977 RepID=UPI003AB4265E